MSVIYNTLISYVEYPFNQIHLDLIINCIQCAFISLVLSQNQKVFNNISVSAGYLVVFVLSFQINVFN